jgi:hypothetical protein
MKRAVAAPWEAIVTVVSLVADLAMIVLVPLAAVVTVPLELVLAVPVVGRLVRQGWSIVTEIVWRLVGLPDLLLGALGVRPEKKLRLQVVILSDENGSPVSTPTRVLQDLQDVIDVYKDEANVRVLPVRWLQLSTPFSKREKADERYVRTSPKPSMKSLLDVECSGATWLKDLGARGSGYQLHMTKLGFWGGLRRILGYGAPLTAFIVRDIKNALGCSLGPLTDYITAILVPGDTTTLFHELGHSCGLMDGGKVGTLMACAGPCGRTMTKLQALVVRNSRHVTYF